MSMEYIYYATIGLMIPSIVENAIGIFRYLYNRFVIIKPIIFSWDVFRVCIIIGIITILMYLSKTTMRWIIQK